MRILVCSFVLILTMSAQAGFEVQNGGGGVVSNGQYLTFQSANIPIQSQSLDIADIPGLSFLIKKIQTLPLRSKTRAQLTRLVMPTAERVYFKADEGRISADLRATLKAEYAKVMGIQQDRVVIFATTDQQSAQTVLFPEFFQLKEIEQAALLLHEGLWTLPGQRTYAQIVQVEMAAQANFETTSPNIRQQWVLLSSLVKMLGNGTELIPVAYQLQAEAIKKRPLSDFFGQEAWQCITKLAGTEREPASIMGCSDAILNRMAILKITEPSNLFADALYTYILVNPNVSAMTLGEYAPRVREYDTVFFTEAKMGTESS